MDAKKEKKTTQHDDDDVEEENAESALRLIIWSIDGGHICFVYSSIFGAPKMFFSWNSFGK